MSYRAHAPLGWVVLAALTLVVGCGDNEIGQNNADSTPTSTPTPTPTAIPTDGPEVSFLGLVRADDEVIEPTGLTAEGYQIYERTASGSGFAVVVEGRPGVNGAAVGLSSFVAPGDRLPDLQVQVSRALGNGSAAVCDDPQDLPGGVPPSILGDFETNAENLRIINDFACRFVDGSGNPEARTTAGDGCVRFESGDFGFVAPDTTVQYCAPISVPLSFPLGDTMIAARLRGIDGSVGPVAYMVVRVVAFSSGS
jgi:hypothetical protein